MKNVLMQKTALAVLLIFFSASAFPLRLIEARPMDVAIDAPASPADDPDPRNQPSIAVSATNDQIIVGASKVVVGGASTTGATRVAHYFSSDGGRTWASSLLSLETPQKTWHRATDPSVASDADGNFYLAALLFDTSSFDTGVYVFKSTDGGRTFTDPDPVVLDIGSPPTDPIRAEKCYITIDRSPSSPFKNTIYAVWMSNDRNEQVTNRVRILMSHRRPGEFGFSMPPKILSHSGDMRGPSLATGPEGEFYAVWEGIGTPRVFLFNASTDGGETFLPVEVAPSIDLNIYRFTGSLSQPSPTILISGVQRMNSFPVMDVDCSAGPNRGMIYITWAEAVNRSDADVFVMRLTPPNGQHPTISLPVRVNDDPAGADQFFPWLSVDETDGSIEVAFYDRRDNIGGSLMNMYLARSTDGGASFVNTRVSADASDPRIQSNIFGAVIGVGDHIALAAARGKAHLMWADTRRGKQEIFYGQIPFTDSGGGGDVPANDSCQSPRVINNLPYLDNLDTTLAASSADDPVLCAGNQGTHSVWYSITPAVDTVYGIDSFTSDFDTTVSVYTGACGALTQVACDDDSGPGNSSLLTFIARAGQTYLIEVAGKGSGGNLRLRLGAPTITSVEYTAAPDGSKALKIVGAGFAENNTRATLRVGSDDLDLPTIFYRDRQGDGTVTTIFATRKKLKKKVKSGRTVIITIESPLGQNILSIPFSFTRP